MMGPRQQRSAKLFYSGFDLEARVDPGHRLRKIAAACDFAQVRSAVAALYGQRGNPSLDPTLLLKLLFLLFYENVSSERELLRQLPCRLDWLWFLEMDLDSPIPDHSVLSKARRRWGPKVFAGFFQQILTSCVQAQLVDGARVHVDGSLMAADAARDKIQVALHHVGEAFYGQLEAATQEQTSEQTSEQAPPGPAAAGDQMRAASAASAAHVPAPVSPATPRPASTPEAAREASTRRRQTAADPAPALPPVGTRYCPTDPQARLTRKYNLTVLGYKDHRVVDDRRGIVTATITTPAAVDEASLLMTLLDRHALSTGLLAAAPVADKAYGTVENYCRLQERGTTPCIPHKMVRENPLMFPRSLFVYDPRSDTYRCPAGQTLGRRGGPAARAADERQRYQPGPGVCRNCPLKSQCTAGQQRIISRQRRQDVIDWADHCLTPGQRRQRLRRRKIRAEGSFADATIRHGYKRARWRGMAQVTIQNLLIAATQNLRKLVRYASPHRHQGAACGAGCRPRHAAPLAPAVLHQSAARATHRFLPHATPPRRPTPPPPLPHRR